MSERKALKSIPFALLAILVFVIGCEKEDVFPEDPILLETNAAWSPDGSTIAYAGSGGIWFVDADGTNYRYFSEGFQADWSPDGERLVIATLGWNIYLIDKDGSNFEWLIQDGQSNTPTWSPDGRWIAFVRPFAPGGLFWTNIETGELGGVANGGGGGWSPDSKQIVFFFGEDQGRKGLIQVVNIEDSLIRTVSEFDAYVDGPLTGIPRWSPDGKTVLFTMDLHTWVVDTNGENLKKLAEYAAYPNWSPDGSKIVFTKCDEDGRLWIMDADGRHKHPLKSKF